MQRYLALACILFAMLPASLSAQDLGCADSATTLAQRHCYSAQLEKEEKTTAALLDSLAQSLTDSAAVALRAASRAWAAYSVAECEAVMKSYAGGSMGLVENLTCLSALNEERRKLLRVYYASDP